MKGECRALPLSQKAGYFILYHKVICMKIVLKRSCSGSKKYRFFIFFVLFILLFVFLSASVLARFKPVFEEKASHAATNKAIQIINDATDSVFSDIDTKELVTISCEEGGKITSVSANTIEMNKLKTQLSKRIQDFTENAECSTVKIPVGSLTNFAVLQGIGYRIPVKISTDGYAKIDFDDKFENTGINQVRHKIYMTVSVKVSVISTVMTKSETVTTEVPVAETVISGTVPNYYGDNISVVGR